MLALLLWTLLAAQPINIGYYGATTDPSWAAASLALERANRDGGYNGQPFRFVVANTPGGMVRLTTAEQALAVISTAHGSEALRIARFAARNFVPLIDVASTTDAAIDGSRMIWVFSCLPAENDVIETVGKSITTAAKNDFAVLYTSDDLSWALGAKFLSWFSRSRVQPRHRAEITGAVPKLPAGTKAVLVLAPARRSAEIIRSLPADVQIFTGPVGSRAEFIKAAGARGNGVRVPVLANTTPGFPDYAAAQTYDAVLLLVAAIRRAGPDRARTRDTLHRLSWPGLAGEIKWDDTGRNRRPVQIGTVVDGRVQP